MHITPEDQKLIDTAYKALDDKFALDIIMLDVREITTITDFFIICTGNNSSAIRAIAAEADEKLGKAGLPVKHVEGLTATNWVLMDFGDVIIHIFDKENRGFYNLERVWGDAPQIEAAK